MLDVTRLRVLAAVARHGSVTAAAKALNYAQPSVSHHLARLEAETGARLVERSGRGVRLTDAGRLLAGRAEEILGRLDAAEQELAAHMGQREERIRVAGFPSALATVVPAAAARLRTDHPGAELLLAEAEPQAAVRMLRAGRVDMALVFCYVQGGTGAQHVAGAVPATGTGKHGEKGPAATEEASTAGQQGMAGPHGAAPPGTGGQPGAPPGVVGQPGAGPPGTGGQQGATSPGAGGQPGATPLGMSGQPGAAPPGTGGTGWFGEEDEGIRARLLLEEPVHLVTQAGAAPPRLPGNRLAGYAEHRWIAGCERCRAHLLWQCELAGFTPQIAFTTDDVLVAQALAATGLGVALLPDLALRAARHPGIRTEPLPGARRQVLALTYGEPPGPPAAERLLDALAEAAEGKGGEARRTDGGAAERLAVPAVRDHD